ncbi:MAG: precorrin-2 C(20)-methyltransferase, partial [Eubacteriaceae bacterium]|nr:precorrin-2 C(20)-methyltransferase [Eubacteriaceae bacterium]
MKGTFYGVGIGPGDPGLMTLKAVRLIENSENIAFPGDVPEETLAYRIVTGELDLSGKKLMGLSFPMSNDKEYVASCHRKNTDMVVAVLEEGKDVVLPVLGDPGVYSTFSYVADLVKERGYETAVIPGITSFCAAAAEEATNLIYGDEQLHILPNAQNAEENLKLINSRSNSYFYGVLWNKLYLREKAAGVLFDEELSWGEDFAYNMQYLKGCDRVAYMKGP